MTVKESSKRGWRLHKCSALKKIITVYVPPPPPYFLPENTVEPGCTTLRLTSFPLLSLRLCWVFLFHAYTENTVSNLYIRDEWSRNNTVTHWQENTPETLRATGRSSLATGISSTDTSLLVRWKAKEILLKIRLVIGSIESCGTNSQGKSVHKALCEMAQALEQPP